MPTTPIFKFLAAATTLAGAALAPLAQAAPVADACAGTLSCYTGVDPGSTDSAIDPSTLPRTNATAARNAFLDRLTGVKTQDFESAQLGSGGLAVVNALASGGDPLQVFPSTVSSFGQAAVVNNSFDGNEYFGRFNTSSAGAGQWIDIDFAFTLEFATPVSGFGFFATDVGDFDGSLEVLLSFVGGGSLTIEDVAPTPSTSTNGSLLFFGVVDDTQLISGVQVRVMQALSPDDPNFSAEIVGFDDLVTGALKPRDPNPVPEPGTLALAGLSLLGLAAARRRRRA